MSKSYQEFTDDGLQDAHFTVSGGDVDRQIRSCLIELRRQPREVPANPTIVDQEGWMYKKRKLLGGKSSWRKYWVVLNVDQLYCYTDPADASGVGSKPKKVIPISFMRYTEMKEEDKLVEQQMKAGASEVCRLRISVFSPSRVYYLSAETDTLAREWIDAINKTLRENMHESDYKLKEDAALALVPLLEEQEALQLERFRVTLKALEQVGFFAGEGTSKVKEGYLELKSAGADSWKKLYFVMFPDNFNYYRLENKEEPYGIIALKFMSAVKHEASLGKSVFSVSTPLRTYFLRAKHEAAMADWINCIYKLKIKSKNMVLTEKFDEENLQGQPITGKAYLVWDQDGKQKKKELKSSTTTVGRSSTNNITLKDRKISRNHFKIEFVDRVPIFSDLGSSKGSKVNRHRTTRVALKVGDVIKAGDTRLTFTVKQ